MRRSPAKPRAGGSRVLRAAPLAAALLLVACAGARGPDPSELRVFEPVEPAPPMLPDSAERAAGRVAALVLADRPDSAAALYAELDAQERARLDVDGTPSGLLDNARDLLLAAEGGRAYERYARRALDDGGLDPALERHLERHLETRPLRVAERRLAEHRTRKLASLFNRIVPSLARLPLGGVLDPVETGRAALASLLVMRSFPTITTHERQALRAYREFAAHNPDAPELPDVRRRIEHYETKRRDHLYRQALLAAERGIEAGRPEVALEHLERADRLIAGRREVSRLRERAARAVERRDARLARSFGAQGLVGDALGGRELEEFRDLARSTLVGPLHEVAALARAWRTRHEPGPLADELRFLVTFDALARRDETAFFAEMEELARLDVAASNMSRHAAAVARSAEQNPYAALEATRARSTAELRGWLLLGRRRHGALRRDLWRPLEWVLDLPGLVASTVTFPTRIFQYGAAKRRFSGPVLHAGERYLQRFPRGEHAEEVHAELERRYADRGGWSQALEHHRQLDAERPEVVADYRERIAERMLEAARLQRRTDVRASIYRMIVVEYPETPQAEQAKREVRQLIAEYTPQRVRLSRAFLLEHPEVWGRGALALHPELLDDEQRNGEIADEGVTLVGRNRIRLALLDAEPLVLEVPAERFARFVALLEQVSYRTLVTDARESAVPDPQRDLFFERARLGLLETADDRPAATSEAEFLSSREKYGVVKRTGSVLPVELVLQGGLEDFGFAAFPRIVMPGERADAFLYR